MQRDNPHISRGFTLIELALVVLVLSVSAGIALPVFSNSLTRYRVHSASFQAAETFNRARSTARSESGDVTVTFDLDTSSYAISASPERASTKTTTSEDYEGVTLAWAIFIHSSGFSLTDVTFDYRGEPYVGTTSSDRNRLTSGSIGFSLGPVTAQVTINPVTGASEVIR